MAPDPAADTSKAGATLARSAASSGAATMASRILGLVRDMVLANYFGSTAAMDAYRLAFKIPNLFRDLFAEGAMSAAFVPTFTRHLSESGRASAWRLGNLVLNSLLVVTGAVVGLGLVFATPLVTFLAGKENGFAGVVLPDGTNKLALTITLARIMLPTLTLVAVAAALMGMLNSLRHFFIPALSPAMFNVVTIILALTLVPAAGTLGIEHPIIIIAVATVLGGVAQLALQWPTLRREGFRYQPVLDWKDPGLRRVLVLMGPGTVGLAATQLNLVVNVYLAARQEPGAVSWLEYAFRLMYLPIGLFGVSIATALLPEVTRHVLAKDTKQSRDSISDGLSLMLMMNVPAMVGLMVLAVPIVRVIFERGEFSPRDTLATAAALQFYAIGLVGYSVVRIASPTFYALGKNRVPVIVSMFTVVVNAVLNVMLVREMGYAGLALGTSIAALFNATVLLVLLRRNLGGLNEAHLLGSLARIALASAAMGAAAFVAHAQIARWVPGDAQAVQVLRVAATIGLSVGVLAASAWVLRIREFHDGMAIVLRRFRRSTPQ